MQVVTLHAFEDNLIYALVDRAAGRAAIVDPGDAAPVERFLEAERLEPAAVLLTHHHRDHVGGLPRLLAGRPGLEVVAAERDRARIPGATRRVGEGDRFPLLGSEARVIDLPGHTLGHVAYFVDDGAGGGDLFSGDTVFGATIGNLFEGTPDDMYASLRKIRGLPPRTRIWCGHEYTLRYVRDAVAFDPGHAGLAARLRRVEAQVRAGQPTVPFDLEEECATSPFFRWDDPQLTSRLGTAPGLETFRRLCEVL